MTRVVIPTAVLTMLVACTSPPDDLSDSTVSSCPEPRPQICTREYDPVCAQHTDGSWRTHSTGCTACTDDDVSGYRPGACEGDA